MSKNDLFNNPDPFGLPPVAEEEAAPGANAPPEYTVSEISQQLKRTVESKFSFVRIRGEISRVTVAKSGHLYTSLKDDSAVMDAICWRGTMSRLSIRPEEGMEVVCTGRLTTYPGRSNYQLIIETMELAGQGALLKMLEDRKKKLEAEGIFAQDKKKIIPFLPDTIGVVTSPTGAVIRDIVHRISDRFPRRILLWPVMVQGQTAAETVAEAINGFNRIPKDSPDRPDVLIIARGGGSLEDLMPFNDEVVVRAVAACDIPVISAIGHETDTTLIDHAADLRAPTPTGAAEKAVPVRAELIAQVMDSGKRLYTSTQRLLQQHQVHLQGLQRGLGDPKRLMETSAQKIDYLSSRLDSGLTRWLEKRGAKLNELSARISTRPLLQRINDTQRIITGLDERLSNTGHKTLNDRQQKLQSLSALLESLSFERVLDRGYSVVYDKDGQILSSVTQTTKNDDINIRFGDGQKSAKITE